MIYTDVEIEKELDEFELKNTVFFVGLLSSFIWDKKSKQVVGYASSPNAENDLMVIETELVELKKDLKSYLKEKEVTETNILVFCINKQFFPPDVEKNRKGKWVRIKILK